MPPVAPHRGLVNIGTKGNPRWWLPQTDASVPAIQPWTLGPVVQAAMSFAAEEPDMAVAALAFLVGLLCPCRARVCAKVIVACCDARIARGKKEKKP